MKLNEICDVRDGTHDSPKYVSEGYPLVTSKNIVNGQLDLSTVNFLSEHDYNKINERSKVDSGDIIMPMIGTIGNPYLVGEFTDFAIKNVALIKFPNQEIINKFILYYLKSEAFVKYVNEKNKGGTQKFLALKDIRNMEVPFFSKSVQQEIIDKLEKVESLIKVQKKELDLLDELVKARFVELFGDPVTNTKGWNTKPLKQLTTKIGSGATPKGGKESYIDNGISLIRSMNVYNDRFEYKELAHITEEQAERLNNVVIEESDVLLNITGASVARCCVVPIDVLPARVNQHVCILRCKDFIDPQFLCKIITNELFQDSLWKLAGSGATREAINKQQVENLSIILPPIELQNQFADFVKEVDKSREIVQKKLETYQELFDKLMQEYFG